MTDEAHILKTTMNQLKLDTTEFSKLISVSEKVLLEYLNSSVKPRPTTMMKIEMALTNILYERTISEDRN